MVLQLARRSQRHLKKASQLDIAASTASLGYVSWDGRTRAPYLARQTVQLFPRKRRGGFVGRQRQPVAPLPNLQISKISHLGLRNQQLPEASMPEAFIAHFS